MVAPALKHNFNSFSVAPSAPRFRLLCWITNEIFFFFSFFVSKYIHMQTLEEHKTVTKMCLFHSRLHSLKLPLIFIAFNHAKTLKPQNIPLKPKFLTWFFALVSKLWRMKGKLLHWNNTIILKALSLISNFHLIRNKHKSFNVLYLCYRFVFDTTCYCSRKNKKKNKTKKSFPIPRVQPTANIRYKFDKKTKAWQQQRLFSFNDID